MNAIIAHARARVCVCVRKREREGGRKREIFMFVFPFLNDLIFPDSVVCSLLRYVSSQSRHIKALLRPAHIFLITPCHDIITRKKENPHGLKKKKKMCISWFIVLV